MSPDKILLRSLIDIVDRVRRPAYIARLVFRFGGARPGGREAIQRIANPSTAVRIRSGPPLFSQMYSCISPAFQPPDADTAAVNMNSPNSRNKSSVESRIATPNVSQPDLLFLLAAHLGHSRRICD